MWYEIIGYAASLLIALSLTMNSLIKLRVYGLAGALLFAIYGLLIGALPVALLNALNIGIHVFYLIKVRNKKDILKILEVRPENKYLIYFLEFHDKGIRRFFPNFSYTYENDSFLTFFVVRNLSVAGVFIARQIKEDTYEIVLDFVVPEYRDFKIGNYIYQDNLDFFKKRRIKKLLCRAAHPDHINYLKRMGFIHDEMGCTLQVG